MKKLALLLASCVALGISQILPPPTLARADQIFSGTAGHRHVHGFQGIAQSIADALEYNLVQPLDRTKPVLFTSFVDIDSLQTSSTFGRLLGEQVASRMAQLGYRIMEPKLRQGSMVIIEGAGEMVLSRDLTNIRDNHDAQAVIVGTYTVVNESIIVSVKLLSTQDGAILSTHDVTLKMTRDLHSLVHKNTSTIQQGPSQAAKDVPNGPLGRGMFALEAKNSLAAKIIQTRLAELQYYKNKIDGIWGKNSRAALSRFKADRQLSGTAWDMQTQMELFRGTGQ